MIFDKIYIPNFSFFPNQYPLKKKKVNFFPEIFYSVGNYSKFWDVRIIYMVEWWECHNY